MKNLKLKSVISLVLAGALSTLCLAGATGCTTSSTEGVAASVNGENIMEEEITTYIESMRTYYGCTSEDEDGDSTWALYLTYMGYENASGLRDDVLENFINEKLVEQFAGDEGIEASEEEIDATVEEMKAYYSDDDAWNEALESAGFEDENDYREAISYSIKYSDLEEELNKKAILESEDLTAAALEQVQSYDGAKRSSHILFAEDDAETAQSVLDQINAGTLDFETAAAEYSTDSSASDGGDVGWDKVSQFVDEYQTALDALAVGEMSGLVQSEYGYHIILCTEQFTAPAEITEETLADLPEDIYSTVVETVIDDEATAEQEAAEEAAEEDGTEVDEDAAYTPIAKWLKEKRDSSDVKTYDMPSDLSYDIDMSLAESNSDDTSTDSTTTDTTTDTTTESTESTDTSTDTSTDSSASTSTDTSTDSSASTSTDTTTEESSTATTN